MTIPYMTKKHFEVLADELAQDKFFYESSIAYHEKLDRMIKYCQASNDAFNIDFFTTRIDRNYKSIVEGMKRKKIGGLQNEL